MTDKFVQITLKFQEGTLRALVDMKAALDRQKEINKDLMAMSLANQAIIKLLLDEHIKSKDAPGNYAFEAMETIIAELDETHVTTRKNMELAEEMHSCVESYFEDYIRHDEEKN